MSKLKSKKLKSNSLLAITSKPGIAEEETPPEPRFLTEDTLHLWKTWDKTQSPRQAVPPHTPNSEYDFDNGFQQLPKPFPDLAELEVPFIRDTGVKCCIDALGAFFGCTDYKFNLLQFWFLDVLTDCLWAAQDDFRLPVDQQKIVLAWILYLIDLLRDSQQNMSRKKFFTVFKEAMLVAAEVVDEGCETVPMPEKLFQLIQEDEQSETWSSSSESESSSSSLEISPEDFANISCIQMEINGKRRRYQLPSEICACDKYDLSSVDSVSESNWPSEKSAGEEESTNFQEEQQENEEDQQEDLEEILFYQHDPRVPSRFLIQSEDEQSEEALEEEETEKTKKQKPACKIPINPSLNSETELDDYHVSEVADQFSINRTSEVSSEITSDGKVTKSSNSNSEEGLNQPNKRPTLTSLSKSLTQNELVQKSKDQEVLKGLAVQKLWEQRLADMENPRKGWLPTDDIETSAKNVEVVGEEVEEETSEEDNVSDDDEWVDVVLEKHKHQIGQDEDKLIVNFGVLRAIIDFVFKYFYESFQFSLIKLAFQATPEIICQKVNREWMVPKKIKGDLVKPKVQQPKVKKVKEKKAKKDKASKKSKTSKNKSNKKSDKKNKKDKSSKKEKSKKAKSVPLTKEQKKELERQRQEQARLEEEMRKIEENKRFMFPLADAATDNLFQSIFDNWIKIDLSKKKKGKGKDKKKKGKK